MSTRLGGSRNVEGALEPRILVEEKSKETVDQYPPDIVEQLKRAAFIEGEAANTYIKRIHTSNNTPEPKVVTVEVRDDSLVIDVEDIVGIVNLTPTATLQIDPKIGWSDILDMFLDVGEQRRALEYQGIPIREFLADDIGIEDVFIVVAVNYLNSVDEIFRHGFIRSFERRRVSALDVRGRIDIRNSLRNFHIPNGIPKHEFIQKIVRYSIPVNDLIYKAGLELQRLFYLYASGSSNSHYTRIFSRLERAIQRLEQRGVTGESLRLADVPDITIGDIPRQRHYYTQAVEISKSILSSSVGQPLDQGREELLMEYILGMESLFEEYSALVLEEELDKLKQPPMIRGLDGLTVEKKFYRLFEDDDVTYSSQPDHVITSDEGPVAILDSKYYGRNTNPLKDNWSRSRLLSYGFHLETDTLGMIAPLAEPDLYSFAGRSGEVALISPAGDEFSTEGLRQAVRDYLRDHIGEQHGIDVFTDLQNRQICHPEVDVSMVEDMFDKSQTSVLADGFDKPQLQAERIVDKAWEILKYIVKDARLSDEMNPRNTKGWIGASRRFKPYLRREAEGYDIVVPFFLPASDEEAQQLASDEKLLKDRPELKGATEFIKLHCLTIDEDSRIADHRSPSPFGLKW